FDETADAILRLAIAARAMLNDELADLETTGRRQYGNEAVQLTVKPDFAEDLRTVTFHAAIVVVQPHAGEPAHQEVEDATGPNFVPRIMANPLPATDDVEPLAEGGDKGRDLL